MNVKRVERGWGGHFVGGAECYFRRNTLLTLGKLRVVVSTIGNYKGTHESIASCVGGIPVYETMTFHACFDDPYWDTDINRPLGFTSRLMIGANDMMLMRCMRV